MNDAVFNEMNDAKRDCIRRNILKQEPHMEFVVSNDRMKDVKDIYGKVWKRVYLSVPKHISENERAFIFVNDVMVESGENTSKVYVGSDRHMKVYFKEKGNTERNGWSCVEKTGFELKSLHDEYVNQCKQDISKSVSNMRCSEPEFESDSFDFNC